MFAFDLLELDGEDLRALPLEERKARLARLLKPVPDGLLYCEHLRGDGAVVYDQACRGYRIEAPGCALSVKGG